MHVLFALPGLHRVRRGAEVVFESVAQEIALGGEHQVTLVGSGRPIDMHRQINSRCIGPCEAFGINQDRRDCLGPTYPSSSA